jgi:ABC-type antimicrobial peptide transport system permease subunit
MFVKKDLVLFIFNFILMFSVFALCLQYSAHYKIDIEKNITELYYPVIVTGNKIAEEDLKKASTISEVEVVEVIAGSYKYKDSENETDYKISGFYKGRDDYITGKIPKKANEILIPESLMNAKGLTIGDEIEIENNAFVIVGSKVKGTDEYLLVSHEYIENSEKPVQACIFLSTKLTFNEHKKIVQQITRIFKNKNVISPDYDSEISSKSLLSFIESILVFIMGIICVSALYSFMLEKRKKTISILSLLGFKTSNITSLILFESILIFITAFAFAAVFIYSYNMVFNNFFLDLGDFLSSAITFFIPYVCFYLLIVVPYSKKTPIQMVAANPL